eukprot:gnl/MRDRNA2_/MRDRNA2_34778_c0_seq1.p1 gnl/MRDRNA2_/MRDRNA2_34778_c0~~gnl/MRDRNA2_/MRDRNA2_34778_c0_seq1.p1  ORF type:complete len:378 (+),score=106.27 gnl/MRDRNA2_/MRDRNA2_34778_c0_seq1:148-1281(+)
MPANIGSALHDRADHLEEDGTKKKVGQFLENRWVEVAICALIIADVILVTIELMIDHNYACIEGTVVGDNPETVVAAHPVKESLFLLQAVATGAWGRGLTGRGLSFLHSSLAAAPPAPSAPNLPVDAGFQAANAESKPPQATAPAKESNEPLKAGDENIHLQEPEPKEVGEHGHAEGKHSEHKSAEGAHGHGEGEHGHEGAHGHGHGEGAHGHGAHGHGHGHGAEALVCETKYGHNAHHIMHTCHTLSILILCIFFVELMLKMWIAPKEFCADWLHLLDLFVVTTSLIIDIYISFLIEERRAGDEEALDAATIATLLVILRLWRVVRIAHGFNEIRNMELEKRHKEMEELEEKKDAEKRKLEEVIRKHGLEAEVEAA